MDHQQLENQDHIYQQQEHRDHIYQQPYDSSQAQAYTHSTAHPYYSYYQRPPYGQPQHHHYQHSAYYQPYHANAYHQPPAHNLGFSMPHEALQFSDATGAGQVPRQQNFLAGVNATTAASVAALSQLTQLAGTVGTDSGVGYYPVNQQGGRSHYRGGHKRGAGSRRAHGRGNFSHQPQRGRGRGRSGGGRFMQQGVYPSSSHAEHVVTEDTESAENKAELPTIPEQEVQVVVPLEVASNQISKQIAHCEICKTYCTSYEILEQQHKNGKRHKKNLKKLEVQNEQKLLACSSSDVPQQPIDTQDAEVVKSSEILSAGTGSNKTTMETQQQSDTTEQPQESLNLETSKSQRDRSGMKRKLKGSRGRKLTRPFEASKGPVKPPIPKVAIPLICDLCNVKCDTQEVLNRHLSGKKHASKLRQFQGHQATYGSVGLLALYPPNPISQNFPQGLQQPFYGPQGSYMPPEPFQAQPPTVSGSHNHNDVAVVPEAQNQVTDIKP